MTIRCAASDGANGHVQPVAAGLPRPAHRSRPDLRDRSRQNRRHRHQGTAPERLVVRVRGGVLAADGVPVRGHVPFFKGVGIWGINMPVAWGFAIVNFVWWIGIGHAGTFISAILLLVFQKWRNSINRFTEAMTLFAVACAGMFPIMHLGRPWVRLLAPALSEHDGVVAAIGAARSCGIVFAVSTYFTVSLLFWYVGIDPRPRHVARPLGPCAGSRSFSASARWAGAGRRSTGSGIR